MIIFIVPKNSGLIKYQELLKDYNIFGENIETRGEDVPLIVSSLIKQGKRVFGITGEDLLKEFLLENRNTGLNIKKRFSWNDSNCMFGKPTLCLLGPEDKNLSSLPKKLIVCINRKYSKIAKKYLSRIEDGGFQFKKIYLSGATEQTFQKNISNLVIDIVYSGTSAKEAGLKVYEKIFSSDIVLIGGDGYEL